MWGGEQPQGNGAPPAGDGHQTMEQLLMQQMAGRKGRGAEVVR